MEIKEYFISRDVKNFEHVFPFSESHENDTLPNHIMPNMSKDFEINFEEDEINEKESSHDIVQYEDVSSPLAPTVGEAQVEGGD